MHRSGVSSLISLVIYTGIIVASIGIAINVGNPILDRMQDTASIRSSIDDLTQIDEKIQKVVAEGKYSSRTSTLRFQRGSYHFDNETEELYYEIETESSFISTHSAFEQGPVLISSNTDVSVQQDEVNGTNCYMMENEYLEACVKNLTEGSDINTSELLLQVYNKEVEEYMNSTLTLLVNGREDTITGTGYTEPERLGDTLGRGRVTAKIDSDYGISYDLHIDLLSGSDFLSIQAVER